jgi:hypothetical protein
VLYHFWLHLATTTAVLEIAVVHIQQYTAGPENLLRNGGPEI